MMEEIVNQFRLGRVLIFVGMHLRRRQKKVLSAVQAPNSLSIYHHHFCDKYVILKLPLYVLMMNLVNLFAHLFSL